MHRILIMVLVGMVAVAGALLVVHTVLMVRGAPAFVAHKDSPGRAVPERMAEAKVNAPRAQSSEAAA